MRGWHPPDRHAVCRRSIVPSVDRRKTHVAMPMDRRKSYVDVIERVLGASHLPDYPPPVFHMSTSPGGWGLASIRVASTILPRKEPLDR
jgi:hypothetical protein